MSKYIGDRIVPKHCGKWNKAVAYEVLSIVLDEKTGDSFMARRDVPVNTELSDVKYWALCSDFSEQMKIYQSDTDAKVDAYQMRMNKTVDDYQNAITHKAKLMEEHVTSAHTDMTANRAAMDAAVKALTARLDANVTARTGANNDYAAEVVDARVDEYGNTYVSLGEALRRHDAFLRYRLKPEIKDLNIYKAENKNLSTAESSEIRQNGRRVAVDYTLNYAHGSENEVNYIRANMGIAYADYLSEYEGKQIVIQIYSDKECQILLGFGFQTTMVVPYCLRKPFLLQKGYNEYVVDTAGSEFQAVNRGENPEYFYIHWCIGSYVTTQPEDGTYHFCLSSYVKRQGGWNLVSQDTVPEVVWTEQAVHAGVAEQAEYAAAAEKAMDSEQAKNSTSARMTGVVSLVNERFHSHIGFPAFYNSKTGMIEATFDSELKMDSSCGFDMYLGTMAELRGCRLLIYKDEAYKLTHVSLNFGANWGGYTFRVFDDFLTNIGGGYYVADFDAMFERIVASTSYTVEADFDGVVYLMVYGTSTWNLSDLEGSITNRYAIYKMDASSASFSGKHFFYDIRQEKVIDLNETMSQILSGELILKNVNAADLSGVEDIMQAVGRLPSNSNMTFDEQSRRFIVPIAADTRQVGDYGFSVCIGTPTELAGHTILVYRDEPFPFTTTAFNAGHIWGNQTYVDIPKSAKKVQGKFELYEFDAIFKMLVDREKCSPDFNGNIYLMTYGNMSWKLDKILEGDTVYNRYGFYKDIPNLLYANGIVDQGALEAECEALRKQYTEVQEECKTLKASCQELEEKLKEVKATAEGTKETDFTTGNVLYGKKYIACGDSFTAGDFSGWADENGKTARSSPVIYDSDWKCYKTYPWWIAKRNHMTLVNEALNGSIMPLSKEYLSGDSSVSEGYRSPFSLKRYKAIPEDADYITIWFGINDAGHTNLGALSDTTNETFYGGWNVVLEWLITNRPYAKIGIIITTGSSAAYRTAVREVARKWGIPYLDMVGSDQTPVMFGRESELGLASKANTIRRNNFLVSSTNGHPNLEAHKYISTFIEAFLRRL